MPRRLEAGPLLVMLGALLLLVASSCPGSRESSTAWDVFEVWDLVLSAFASAAIAAAIGLLTRTSTLVDRRWLPATVPAAVVVVAASQILDPPPAATGQDPRHRRLAGAGRRGVMCAGAVLTFSRVRLALTVEGRDQRRHVPAVDARGDEDTGDGAGGVARGEQPVRPGPASAEPPPEPPSGAAAPDAIAAARAEDDEAPRRSRERRRRRLDGQGNEAPEEKQG